MEADISRLKMTRKAMERPFLRNAKVNEKYVSRKLCLEEKEDRNSCEIPWPAKNYSCSFCRREFRSAQALGGHMNVHRRDRARLRLLPSWISGKPYTYPNPNFSSSESSPDLLHFSCKHHSYSSSSTSLTFLSSPFLTSADQEKSSLLSFSGPLERHLAKRKSVVGEAEGLARDTEFDQVLKKEKIISLDLKERPFKDPTEYVDLELRLGYV